MKIPEGTQIRSQREKMFIVDLMFKLMAWLSLNVFFPQAFITPDYLGIQVLTGGRMYMSNKRKKNFKNMWNRLGLFRSKGKEEK